MRLPKTPRRWRYPGHQRWWMPVLLVPLVLALGCGTENFKPEPKANDPDLFRQLELNHHAVTLGMTDPYDTLRLVATPRNYEGTALPDLPAPQYVSRDQEKVAVTTDGLLEAVIPTSQPVWVVATVTTDNLKHADSVLVKVVALDPPPVLASFSVHPLPPDTAKLAVTSYVNNTEVSSESFRDTLPVHALDPSDVRFDSLITGGIPVSFRSSDPTIATIGRTTGIVTGLRPGTVTFFASTTAFGVAKADVLPYRIGFPLNAYIAVWSPNSGPLPGSFSHPEYWVGTGANVNWYSASDIPTFLWPFFGSLPTFEVDVTFDEADLPNVAAHNPALATSGDPCKPIPVFPVDTLIRDCGSGNIVLGRGLLVFDSPPYAFVKASRSFPVPGTYEYRSTIHGTGGKIIVVAE